MNDMSQVIVPRSDQWNADDFISGPMTVTIKDVKIAPGSEQPVNILLEGSDKAFRPCKSSCRVLVHAWGADAKAYIGRSLTLYRDASVKWGGLEVGGIRISHLSDLDGPMTMMLTATKGSRKPHKVLPLAVDKPRATSSDPKLAKAEEWLAWLKGEVAGADVSATRDIFAKAEKTLGRLKAEFPALHAEAMKLAPAAEVKGSSIDQLVAKIEAATSEEVDQVDKDSDSDRAFMTGPEIDRLDQALAARREHFRSVETVQ